MAVDPPPRAAGDAAIQPWAGGAAPDRGDGFAEHRAQLTRSWLVVLYLLGVVLVPGFHVLDRVLIDDPRLVARFALYRGAVVLAMLLVLVILWRGWLGARSRRNYLYGYAGAVLAGGGIILMCRDLGGFTSGYYAGVNLVLLATCSFVPWSLRHSLVATLLLLALYVGVNLTVQPVDGSALTNNLFFIIATATIAAVATDVRTRTLRSEHALRARLVVTEGRFRAVATSASDGIIVCDDHERIVFWNRGAEEIFGHDAREIEGAPLSRVLPRRPAPAGPERRTELVAGARADGSAVPCEVTTSAFSDGRAWFQSMVVRDVTERARAEEALREDLEEARRFQLELLGAPTARGGVPYEVIYRPATSVGGDVYNVHPLPGGGVRVLLADTTGHGVQAALRAMVVSSLYERRRTGAPDAGAALAALNDDLCALRAGRHLLTVACCFDVLPRAGGPWLVRYASAAHPASLRTRPGEVSELQTEGPFLGLMPGLAYPTLEVELAPGERLFAFTDGLLEQESPAGERFGEDRLRDAFAAPGALRGVLEAAVAAVERFSGREHLDDDVAIVAVEIPS
jgi:PAS domain S-box-containing protein